MNLLSKLKTNILQEAKKTSSKELSIKILQFYNFQKNKNFKANLIIKFKKFKQIRFNLKKIIYNR